MHGLKRAFLVGEPFGVNIRKHTHCLDALPLNSFHTSDSFLHLFFLHQS